MRPFVVIDAEQRSEGWYQARAGRLTGSRAGDMLAKVKSGEAAGRRDLRVQLAIERLTGKPIDDGAYLTKDVQRGRDLEPRAIAAYEAETGLMIQRTGFLARTDCMAGCSLDGHVNGFEGIQEFKCPKSATHVHYLRTKQVPSEYVGQVVHNLWVSGAQWCDFISYDDRMPPGLEYFCVRVNRSEAVIQDYQIAALKFLVEVGVEAADLMALRAA